MIPEKKGRFNYLTSIKLWKSMAVSKYDSKWKAFNMKEVKQITKAAKSFKISKARVTEFQNGKLGMRAAYNGHTSFHTIIKCGFYCESFTPSPLAIQFMLKKLTRRMCAVFYVS